VTHSVVPESDTRSVWQAIPTSQVLSVSDQELNEASIAIYPNPASDKFTIKFEAINTVERVEIYNVLGQAVVLDDRLGNSVLEVDSRGFEAGLYLVKAYTADNKVLSSKLIIK
jgi:putative ubiquitin-RnfH superfamily antitoxin RatB of RatAB toxin-antitoxin module